MGKSCRKYGLHVVKCIELPRFFTWRDNENSKMRKRLFRSFPMLIRMFRKREGRSVPVQHNNAITFLIFHNFRSFFSNKFLFCWFSHLWCEVFLSLQLAAVQTMQNAHKENAFILADLFILFFEENKTMRESNPSIITIINNNTNTHNKSNNNRKP